MQIELITNESDWAALEAQWDALVERSGSASVFLTMEWLWSWWRHYGRSRDRLYILVARERESVIGLAPLYRNWISSYGLGSLRRIGFIGDSSYDSDYLDFVIEPGREADVLPAFVQHIAADPAGWDIVDLRLLPKASPSFEHIMHLASDLGCDVRADEFPCASVALPDDWETYLKTLKSRRRHKVRTSLRRLSPEHGALFDECTDPRDLPGRLESMFELHQTRWRATGEPGTFALPARRRFYYDIAERFLDRGWLRFYSLQLHGRFVAHEFSLEHLGRVYYLQQGYDIAYENLSLGNALRAYVIRDSIARGAREYDFLGGTAAHKLTWGAEPRWYANVTLVRASLRMRWRSWLSPFVSGARKRLGHMAPMFVRRLKRAVQDWRRS